MLYKINSMGYFGGVFKLSRGPWFREFMVEDDGLEWYYSFVDSDGNHRYLISNNMAVADRDAMSSLYRTMARNNLMSWGVGLWLGMETVARVGPFKGMKFGRKALSCLFVSYIFKSILMQQTAAIYGPTMQAYLRKYADQSKTSLFEIHDDKKSYFYIDTSEYMRYSNKDLGDEYHCGHGPQPEGESLNASW